MVSELTLSAGEPAHLAQIRSVIPKPKSSKKEPMICGFALRQLRPAGPKPSTSRPETTKAKYSVSQTLTLKIRNPKIKVADVPNPQP